MEERLQKLLSAAGVCSRRTAETYLIAGRVTVNGQTAHLGQRADPDRDEILVDGRPLAPRAEAVYILLNKPRGYVSTLSDERGRRTVAELVADCGSRVYPVGRLDLDSEGLLLLTNDGAWAQHLLHPKHEVEKTYHVSVFGPVAGAAARLPVARVANLTSALKDLKKQGVWIFGTAAGASTDLYSADLKGPAAIVIGSEGDGMSRLVAENCDFLVSIPMKGHISSLNASAAAAILLYEAVRQRRG